MITIGLTGGIATGKDTVAHFLRKKGSLIIDADRIGHELLKNKDIKKKVTSIFGIDILDTNNDIDRSKLAQLVFKNKETLENLNQIIHPKIIQKIKKLMKEYQQCYPDNIIIVNAALIFEFGIENIFDYIILLRTDEKTQLERCSMKGLSQQHTLQRIRLQPPHYDKLGESDFDIFNNGTRKELLEKIDRIWEKILEENKKN